MQMGKLFGRLPMFFSDARLFSSRIRFPITIYVDDSRSSKQQNRLRCFPRWSAMMPFRQRRRRMIQLLYKALTKTGKKGEEKLTVTVGHGKKAVTK